MKVSMAEKVMRNNGYQIYTLAKLVVSYRTKFYITSIILVAVITWEAMKWL